MDEDFTAQCYKEMFEEEEYLPAERSMHTAIPPANIRIRNFERKSLD
jgi:hypothetical protein